MILAPKSTFLNLMVWCSKMDPKLNFNTTGLIKAMVTEAAAWTPPESENTSIVSPKISDMIPNGTNGMTHIINR